MKVWSWIKGIALVIIGGLIAWFTKVFLSGGFSNLFGKSTPGSNRGTGRGVGADSDAGRRVTDGLHRLEDDQRGAADLNRKADTVISGIDQKLKRLDELLKGVGKSPKL